MHNKRLEVFGEKVELLWDQLHDEHFDRVDVVVVVGQSRQSGERVPFTGISFDGTPAENWLTAFARAWRSYFDSKLAIISPETWQEIAEARRRAFSGEPEPWNVGQAVS